MQIITGIAGFKQLVRLAARCFYSGQVPPPDTTRNKRKVRPPAMAAAASHHTTARPAPSQRLRHGWVGGAQGMDTRGLAVVALDALTRREWVEVWRRRAPRTGLPPCLLRP